MAHTLHSARALLDAKSFVAARRAVAELLKERPQDPALLIFAAEIEKEDGNNKASHELIRSALTHHPDNVLLREEEVLVLSRLRKKRQARDALERFKRDFPHARFRIENLTVVVDSLYGRSAKLKRMLDSFGEARNSPHVQRELGIAHHKINDLFTAQRLLEAAHEHFSDDAVLNETVATNSFQLGLPGRARTYARLALKSSPDNRRLRWLYWASYLLYFPPFYVATMFMAIVLTGLALFGRLTAGAICLALVVFFGDLYSFWFDALSVLAQWPVYKWSYVGYFLFFAIYLLVGIPDSFNKIIPRRRNVILKKY